MRSTECPSSYSCITGSARSLPARSSTVSVQVNQAGQVAAGRRRSHVTTDSLQSRPSASPSAVIVPSPAVSAAAGTTAAEPPAAGPGRSHNATQWLSPENAGCSRTATAAVAPEMTSCTTSSRHGRSPEVSVDACDVNVLSDLDAQLETLKR